MQTNNAPPRCQSAHQCAVALRRCGGRGARALLGLVALRCRTGEGSDKLEHIRKGPIQPIQPSPCPPSSRHCITHQHQAANFRQSIRAVGHRWVACRVHAQQSLRCSGSIGRTRSAERDLCSRSAPAVLPPALAGAAHQPATSHKANQHPPRRSQASSVVLWLRSALARYVAPCPAAQGAHGRAAAAAGGRAGEQRAHKSGARPGVQRLGKLPAAACQWLHCHALRQQGRWRPRL